MLKSLPCLCPAQWTKWGMGKKKIRSSYHIETGQILAYWKQDLHGCFTVMKDHESDSLVYHLGQFICWRKQAPEGEKGEKGLYCYIVPSLGWMPKVWFAGWGLICISSWKETDLLPSPSLFLGCWLSWTALRKTVLWKVAQLKV